jgi:restriction system protein
LLQHANHALAGNLPTIARQPPTETAVPAGDRPDRSPSAKRRPDDPAASTETTSLAQLPEKRVMVAGQNVPLGQPRFRVNLLATDADLSALLVGTTGRVDRDEDFIFYNNPRSANEAVTLTGNIAAVATDLLPPRCERVVLVVSTDSDAIADATAVLHQSGVGVDLRFSPVDTARMSALVWGEIYLRDGNWRLRAVGQGWSDGLAGLARDYGVNVD